MDQQRRKIFNSFCTYCGSGRDIEADHLIPHAFRSVGNKRTCVGGLVPACRECNFSLSDELFFDVQSRAAFLLEFYLGRWKWPYSEEQRDRLVSLLHVNKNGRFKTEFELRSVAVVEPKQRCIECQRELVRPQKNTKYCGPKCGNRAGHRRRRSTENVDA